MSASVPNSAANASAENALTVRRPWPRITVRVGGSVFEWRGLTLFLRLAGTEVYVCTAEVSDWWTLREPGCFEAAMGRVRLSAARSVESLEP
jgi:hypothetical protein